MRNLRKMVSLGRNNITNEMVRFGGVVMTENLTEIFNKIVMKGRVREKLDIIILYNKGDRHKVGNYRSMNLSLII